MEREKPPKKCTDDKLRLLLRPGQPFAPEGENAVAGCATRARRESGQPSGGDAACPRDPTSTDRPTPDSRHARVANGLFQADRGSASIRGSGGRIPASPDDSAPRIPSGSAGPLLGPSRAVRGVRIGVHRLAAKARVESRAPGKSLNILPPTCLRRCTDSRRLAASSISSQAKWSPHSSLPPDDSEATSRSPRPRRGLFFFGVRRRRRDSGVQHDGGAGGGTSSVARCSKAFSRNSYASRRTAGGKSCPASG